MKFLVDQAAHILISVCGLAAVALAPAWWSFSLAGFLFAITREDAQHRPAQGWGWPFKGWGRWIDIGFGALGGFAAYWLTLIGGS